MLKQHVLASCHLLTLLAGFFKKNQGVWTTQCDFL